MFSISENRNQKPDNPIDVNKWLHCTGLILVGSASTVDNILQSILSIVDFDPFDGGFDRIFDECDEEIYIS